MPLRALRAALSPASWLFGAAVALRTRRFDRVGGERVDGMRVISVGNLAVGGTGKTPVSAWIAATIRSRGGRPALLTRGTGGDEVLLHRRWNPDVPVIVDADRVAGARDALARECDTAVLDDGFQHRRLARDVDVVLLAAEDPFPGRLLPAGPYREPTAALSRADVIVVTRRTASVERAAEVLEAARSHHPGATFARVTFRSTGWRRLGGEPCAPPVGTVTAVSGIARPEPFARAVEASLGDGVETAAEGRVRALTFPDHHPYSEADWRRIQERAGEGTVVVTEKDAVKFELFQGAEERVRVLVQEPVWESGEEEVVGVIEGVMSR